MTKRRWMKSALIESRKDQIEMPWARQLRAARRAEIQVPLKKAS
ncbi:hypothetical protein [Rhodophyticola sp. CCM32]|nr:hypothetical protein [Rhodophyticola sp. CCM32]